MDMIKNLHQTNNFKINPRGGLIGCGHPLGATGISQTIEIIEQLQNNAKSRQTDNPKTGLVFAGTNTKRQLSGNLSDGGWSNLIDEHSLKVLDTVSLPTVWTFDQTVETPYIFTKFK